MMLQFMSITAMWGYGFQLIIEKKCEKVMYEHFMVSNKTKVVILVNTRVIKTNYTFFPIL